MIVDARKLRILPVRRVVCGSRQSGSENRNPENDSRVSESHARRMDELRDFVSTGERSPGFDAIVRVMSVVGLKLQAEPS